MSRTAATMLGFVLVALSIGFNTMRYPAVWEMAGPAQANESVQAAAVSPPEKTESLAPASSPSLTGQAESRPNPEPAERIAADRSTSAETNPPGNAASAVDAGSPSGTEPQRPLVPVTRQSGTELAGGVRRLPPVDRVNSVRMDRGAGSVFSGPIPAYPSTGM
jgi:hypothetical protein